MSQEENIEINTYFDIAIQKGLTGRIAGRYILYMTRRWGNKEDERIKCLCGYASEWAERFASGQEYNCSDSHGKLVLKEIENEQR